MSKEIYALILAAGKGTRMKSKLNKVLHPVCGLSMIEQVILQLKRMSIHQIGIVVGHQHEQVISALDSSYRYIEQKEQLGTGHAVKVAKDWLADKQGTTLVLCGDTPLLTTATLSKVIDLHTANKAACTILTAIADNPTGYGRIIRDQDGKVIKIVEQKDASEKERGVKEVNSGIYCFDNQKLFNALERITDNNAQNEYYLTDVIEILNGDNQTILPCVAEDFDEIVGVNDRVALAKANEILRRRILQYWMRAGVTIIDPNNTYIDSLVELGQDIVIYPGTYLRGLTKVADDCSIGPNTEIEDCTVGAASIIKQSVVLKSDIGKSTHVGPFAYIRPGSQIGDDVKIGDFVEIKNSKIGNSSKVSHLSYIGDAVIGNDVNVGCGSITVNYDGKNKHQTTIDDGAFIGCNSNLIAPVTVKQNAFVAAGSTITKDVPENSLAFARSRQTNKLNYRKD
nr:bifunctional UDP-N-acetylglucosamine diphosphorylase/glucosamine-1-phosphate N-acetyltransferase GlmU [Desulfuribacillus alkaliarsenatis]